MHCFFTARWLGTLLLACGVLVGLNGCTPANDSATSESEAHDDHDHEHDHDHDHGDEYESYAAAVAAIAQLRDSVRDGMAADNHEEADEALHEIGHLLEHVPELAEKASADSIDVDAVKQAVDTLLDAFGRIDETLHGGEGSTYDDESAEIDAAIATLQDQAAAKS